MSAAYTADDVAAAVLSASAIMKKDPRAVLNPAERFRLGPVRRAVCYALALARCVPAWSVGLALGWYDHEEGARAAMTRGSHRGEDRDPRLVEIVSAILEGRVSDQGRNFARAVMREEGGRPPAVSAGRGERLSSPAEARAAGRGEAVSDSDLVAAFMASEGVKKCPSGMAAGLTLVEASLGRDAFPKSGGDWKRSDQLSESARRRRVAEAKARSRAKAKGRGDDEV